MSELGTKTNPFTHDNGVPETRSWKWCKCAECGIVALCTPSYDFYAKNDGDPLRCERTCYWVWLNAQKIAPGIQPN